MNIVMRRASRPELLNEFRLTIPVVGTGSNTINVFKVLGPVRVIEQVATIVEVTTLTNLTNVYADAYDGTISVPFASDGADLSGAPVWTHFTKDKTSDQPYSVNLANQIRVSEVTEDKRVGKPFTVTPKYGADNYIRLHYTTTDNPVDFKMFLRFIWEGLDGGYLELA